MDLVLIEWVDSFGCSATWQSLAGCEPEVMVCRSVGWLVYNGDDCKVVVPHLSPDDEQGCGDMTIPVEAIKTLTKLDVPCLAGSSPAFSCAHPDAPKG